MPADYLLPGLDANFGGLMFANFVCVVVYAILMFCMLHAVMENTKRTNALLAQLISFQQRSPEPKSTNSLPPPYTDAVSDLFATAKARNWSASQMGGKHLIRSNRESLSGRQSREQCLFAISK